MTIGVVMTKKVVLTLLALAVTVLPAAAQNQFLTSFVDSAGPHVYYQAWSPPYDLWQIAPTFPWSGDMNSLSVCTNMGNPPPENWGNSPSPLASFADFQGQHVVYIDNHQADLHVHDLQISSCLGVGVPGVGAANEDMSILAAVSAGGVFPSEPNGRSLTAFSDDRGKHYYYTGVDGHVHHIFFRYWCPSSCWPISHEDLTDLVWGTLPPACGFVNSALTGFSDKTVSPNIELVYYVGGSGHLCELAWYQGGEQSYDLTAMCGSGCGDGPPQPMLNSPLTGFTDSDGQHLFYLDSHSLSWTDGIHVHESVVGPNGLSTQDLTARSRGNWAAANSLTSFSDAFGPQVFFVDISNHVNQLNAKALTNKDLTASFGGALIGTSLTGSFDQWGREDVFYISWDQHVWQLHSEDGSTWSPHNLTQRFGTPIAF